TASPLTNHGTILSTPERNTPSDLPPGVALEPAAATVAALSPRLRPRLPACVGHCIYVKRIALDIAGPFDEAFSPGYGEEVDFSQRCARAGLAHVCADDVFVHHRGGASFGATAATRALREDHERLLATRYPSYHAWVAAVASTEAAPLATCIAIARRALL